MAGSSFVHYPKSKGRARQAWREMNFFSAGYHPEKNE
jgi:hypothetical protein